VNTKNPSPVSQGQDKAGRLMMPGATQDRIKAMAAFSYETKVGETKQATEAHWKAFAASGSAATACLRKLIGTAAG
jgi:hypothetical protein